MDDDLLVDWDSCTLDLDVLASSLDVSWYSVKSTGLFSLVSDSGWSLVA